MRRSEEGVVRKKQEVEQAQDRMWRTRRRKEEGRRRRRKDRE